VGTIEKRGKRVEKGERRLEKAIHVAFCPC